MKKIFLTVLMIFSVLISPAQMKWNAVYQSYIDQYKDLAIRDMLRYYIPASITLAQGLFESAAGQSRLARLGNNHFGIKCHDWTGRSIASDDDAIGECFRAYNSPAESYEDHCLFLAKNSRYSSLFKLAPTDYKGWAFGLKACGYATNPRYAHKLIEIIELYKLDQYDRAKSYDQSNIKPAEKSKASGGTELLHPIYRYNENYYIYARPGDSFKSIGQEIGINYKKIAKYNERGSDDPVIPGEAIFLKKKQNHALKFFKGKFHTVREGESLYSISQMYGIRLKSLYKMNRLDKNYQIKVGDVLRIY